MSKLYVNELVPKDAAVITAPALDMSTIDMSTAIMPQGSVIQVVQQTNNTYSATSATSYVDVGLSAYITPKYSTSNILVLINVMLLIGGNRQDNNAMYGIYYGGTASMLAINRARHYDYGGSGIYNTIGRSMAYLHSPNTINQCQYSLRVKGGTSGVGLNDDMSSEGLNSSTITLMEIAQ